MVASQRDHREEQQALLVKLEQQGFAFCSRALLNHRPDCAPTIAQMRNHPHGQPLVPMEQAVILVLETDVLVRHEISEFLRECGFRVIEGATREEVIKVLEVAAIQPDVLLAELSDSAANFELSQHVRENYPGIGILLSGSISASAKKAVELCHGGPNPKKRDYTVLERRIRALLAQQTQSREPDQKVG
ncbi:hypothetical protein EOA13_15685 [Mesorhizobium sp. M7A.F.Ca.US.011.01.1.1]|uniref:hypothetical protein n=1 Tax=unclassified Mesorhizobium TaxID=325217 RepID=UPI000FCC7DDD|nr:MULTISPECIES: hypothetical protein [unclassified Mesorhizobium]RUW89863.1 hypothetical protein EOA19_22795 [Mesorhizobium sp. M7A.F.Ca.US.010.02.1.1]RUX28841.1 hypothetical protein EOA13_15685 [Mesorhizobium sp. M7A.F.Ca.US.011.01.1.1]